MSHLDDKLAERNDPIGLEVWKFRTSDRSASWESRDLLGCLKSKVILTR